MLWRCTEQVGRSWGTAGNRTGLRAISLADNRTLPIPEQSWVYEAQKYLDKSCVRHSDTALRKPSEGSVSNGHHSEGRRELLQAPRYSALPGFTRVTQTGHQMGGPLSCLYLSPSKCTPTSSGMCLRTVCKTEGNRKKKTRRESKPIQIR